jgi:hypothetical protein
LAIHTKKQPPCLINTSHHDESSAIISGSSPTGREREIPANQRRRPTGSHPSWSSLFHLEFFSGTFLRARRLVSMFYCNLLPAGAKKQETKKIFTTVSKSIDFLPSGVNYPHEVGNYPSFFCCTRSYVGLRKSQISLFSPAEDMTSSPPFKSPTGPRLLLDLTALHCSAGCHPAYYSYKYATRCGVGVSVVPKT